MTVKIYWSKNPSNFSIMCDKCSSIIEFYPPVIIHQQVKVQCYKCQVINTIKKDQLFHFEDTNNFFTSCISTYGTNSGCKRVRGIILDENPLSREFYESLEASPTVVHAEIKKKYNMLDLKHHPDKCSSPNAKEKSENISVDYQILNDGKFRQKYEELSYDLSTVYQADIESFFKQCFIDERFVDIIGNVSLTRNIKNILINGVNESKGKLSPKEKKLMNRFDTEKSKRELKERINVLAKNLIDKISSYIESESRDSEEEFRQKIINEVEELKYESFGVELLRTIGNIYSLKAIRYLDCQQPHRIFNFAKEARYFFTNTNYKLSGTYFVAKVAFNLEIARISLRSAYKKRIDQAEKDQLEQKLNTERINLMRQGTRLEVTGVIHQVCDRILGDTTIPKSKLLSRARGLKIIGDLYLV